MLSSTVQEQAAIIKRRSLVVVQQTTLPDFPGARVLELGYGSVEERDGCAGLVMCCHPAYCLVDAVRGGVQQTLAQLILWIKHN